MKLYKRRKIIVRVGYAVSVIVLLCVVFFVVFVFRGGVFGRAGGGAMSQNSYNKTAWKFASLVQAGVLYPVVRDIDGDTIIVDVDGNDISVRLIGADTPETVDPRKPVQCYGPEATAEAKRIFGKQIGNATSTGVSVYLDKDPLKGDYDKYGRLLAYIRLPQDIMPIDTDFDGTGSVSSTTDLYNEYMIMRGFAHEYTYLNQRYTLQKQFKAAEYVAKKARLGLWGKCSASGD